MQPMALKRALWDGLGKGLFFGMALAKGFEMPCLDGKSFSCMGYCL